MDTCKHEDTIIDEHNGDVICITCGVVTDRFFITSSSEITKFETKSNFPSEMLIVKDILDHLNLPTEKHFQNIKQKFKTRKISNMRKIVSEIYQEVNKNDSSITLKELQNLTGVKTKQVKTENVSQVNIDKLLEKYTNYFKINYKNFTLIKENMDQYMNTGYQPLTIIGGLIYNHFKNANKKVSMNKIAQSLGINPVSIQRFQRIIK